MKKTKNKIIILIIIVFVIFCLIAITTINLKNNKTFFKNVYIGVHNEEIFIPKYSYFKNECCMTGAHFYSLKSEKQLKKEINNYMKDFEFFENDNTYGYLKGDLYIQSYEVVDHGLYRTIHITY